MAARSGRTGTGTGSPGSRRLQRGGFCSERDAAEALERALEHLRRQKGVGSTLTFRELVEEYLAQHDAEPETIDKLSWLLAKALRAFGGRRLPELRSQEIAAWRMTISPGHRFEATQAFQNKQHRAWNTSGGSAAHFVWTDLRCLLRDMELPS